MLRVEKLTILEDAIEAIKAAKRAEDSLEYLMLSPGSPVYQAGDFLRASLITTLEVIFEDDGGWIDWFVYENNCGDKQLRAGSKGNYKAICTAEDLLDLIEDKQ